MKKIELLMRSAAPIPDFEIHNSLQAIGLKDFLSKDTPYRFNDPPKLIEDFLSYFKLWIESSQLNTIKGLGNFSNRYLISGVTQSFDDFYIRHCEKKIVFLPGEYTYLRRFLSDDKWRFFDGGFSENEIFIISTPFSATGCLHPEFYTIMELANAKMIPTMIDCAFFGICSNLNINLDYPCIDNVSFSYSKAFSSGSFRSGIQFSNVNRSPIAAQNKWHYVQLLSAKVCMELAKLYSPDYIHKKYKAAQVSICSDFGLKASDTIIFGTSHDEKYDFYVIDNYINRCCLSDEIINRSLVGAAV